MPLDPGTKLGPYEITEPLGAGGMGEVYRARDTRLERTVAVKILPTHLSNDPVRKQRFEREAKTISGLNHPNICVLHDVGHQDGVDYLVMEYVEGETLEKRLEKGALPIEQLLQYGIQITEALEIAHKAGITHRDLKPGNIMLAKNGAKLLDFGLAKLTHDATPAGATLTGATLEPRSLTAEGTLLGTFQYMAPEQLEGKEADARTDIFALGTVLYEMATGSRAFTGKSKASLIAAILDKDPPPISSLRPMSPPALDRVVKLCLAKDTDERWQTAHDLKLQLNWIAEGGSQAGVRSEVAGRRKRREMILAITAAALFVALALTLPFTISRWRETPPSGATLRFLIAPPERETFEPDMALSPDGRQLAFVTRSESGTHLSLRLLSSVESHALPGTQNAWQPFWSPDGRYLAFFADSKLKKISIANGAVQTLSDASDPRGGAWSRTGVILFAPRFNVPLYSISAEGGEASPVTTLDSKGGETGHRFPHFLPDGRHFLFFRYYQQLARKPVWVGSLDSKDQKQILESASKVQYTPQGYLVYVRENALVAQRFDVKSLKVAGTAIPLVEGIETEGENGLVTGRSDFAIADSGVLAYRGHENTQSLLTWFDRKGKTLNTVRPGGDLDEPALSPDGKAIAITRQNPGELRSIWIYDLARETQSRLTFEPTHDDGTPIWTPDGKRIIFVSNRMGFYDLYWKLSNGAAKEEVLYSSGSNLVPDEVSPDGRYLFFEQNNPRGHFELWVLPLTGERKPSLYFPTDSDLNHATFSPDGHWVAYVSNESGRTEVYIQSFPATGAKFQISNGGADYPVWRRDGKELLYVSSDMKIVGVPVESTPNFQVGAPHELFPAQVRQFGSAARTEIGVSGDGQRILVNALQLESVRTPITVVVNWTSELEK